jgi:hypothetical protein
VRPRTIRRMLRDSHAGSILIAQFLATGLGALIIPLSWLIAWFLTSLVNYVAVQGFRANLASLNGNALDWKYWIVMAFSGIFVGAATMLAAYLIAVWIFAPTQRVSRRTARSASPSA